MSTYYSALSKNTKVICNKTCQSKEGFKCSNGKIGVVVENTDEVFTVDFGDNCIANFRSSGQVCGKATNGKSKFSPAHALTVHKSQGKTMTKNVIIDPRDYLSVIIYM